MLWFVRAIVSSDIIAAQAPSAAKWCGAVVPARAHILS